MRLRLNFGAKVPAPQPEQPSQQVAVSKTLQPQPELPATRAKAHGAQQEALLEQLGLKREEATDNLRRALAAPETRPTDPALEAKLGALVRGLLKRPAPSAQALGEAFAGLSAADLSLALHIGEARIAGLAAELEGPARKSFLERGGRLLADLEFVALKAQLTLPGQASPTDLLNRMTRAREVLELGKGAALYSLATPPLAANYDPFTNEPGLDATLRKVTVKGGAAVGVSGSIFDVASRTKADLIVSVDANPDVASTIAVFTAILLLVDQRAKDKGWSDKKRAEEVFARLDAGRDPARTTALLRELESVPLSEEVRLRLPAMLHRWDDKLIGKDAVQQLWCRGPDSVERVAHLSKLAREGRIFAITGDLSDPRVPARVGALAELFGTQVSSLNFSNIIDYVPSIDVLAQSWRTLPFQKDAVLICSASHQREALRDNPELAPKIGTFSAPAATSAEAWLGPGGVAEQWAPLAWKTFGFQTSIWSPAVQAISGLPFYFVREGPIPRDPQELEALTNTWIQRSFGTPEAAQRRMHSYFEWQGWLPLYEAAVGADAFAARSLPVAAGPGSLAAEAERFDRTMWSNPDDKVKAVRQVISGRGVDPDSIPGLDAWARRCPGAADLAILVRTVAPEKKAR
ncbi:MAG: hypothetical protein U1E65_21590 [Myxococcota bacterium]